MAVRVEEDRVCGHCGQSQRLVVAYSDTSWGSPDLDTRPPRGMADGLGLSVQQCASCGRVAGDLRAPATAAEAAVIVRPAYRALLADASLPQLVRRFQALAMLCEAQDDAAGVASAWWHAAWAADDAAARLVSDRDFPCVEPTPGVDPFDPSYRHPTPVRDPLHAGLTATQAQRVRAWQGELACGRACRREAAGRWRAAAALGRPAVANPVHGALILADLLRRGGDFEAAIARAEAVLATPSASGWDDVEGDVLRFQVLLARRSDDGPYRVEQAEQAEPGWPARRGRREERARAIAAERERVQAEQLAWCVPAHLGAPLARLLQHLRGGRPGRGPVAPELLLTLPMPAGVAEAIARLAVAGHWPARSTVAAIGLALLRVAPELGWQAEAADWERECTGHEALVEHLAFVFRRCRPDMWHYWPPASPEDGPPPPRFSGAAK